MAKVNINLEVMESKNYFWSATGDKEKVGEAYLVTIAEHPGMKALYGEEFTEDSVRKVLSAISNREPLRGTKPEMRFWNNNMWMLEDLEFMNMMLNPLKALNLNDIEVREDVEVVFIPGHMDVCYKDGNKLIVNFFSVKADLYDENVVTIEDKDLKKWFEEKLWEDFAVLGRR